MENENNKLKKALTSFSKSVSDKFAIAKKSETRLGIIDKALSKHITNWLFKKEVIKEDEKEGITKEISGIIKTIKEEVDESESAKSIFESFLPVIFEFFERSSDKKEE